MVCKRIRLKIFITATNLLLVCGTYLVRSANAATLVETFSNPDQCDYAVTTGLWNSHAGQAQAAAFAGNADGVPGAPADASRPINFGDGSDGVLNTANGFTFDSTKPGGYQFKDLVISGGTIQVTGNQPLVIRSWKRISITPSIDISGGNGQSGATGGVAGAGGTAVAGGGTGGSGGAPATPGNPSLDLSSVPDAAGGTAGNPANPGNASTNFIFNPNLDTGPAPFAGGGSGGGGGSVGTAGGGGGGAGGGFLRLTAMGPIQLGGGPIARGGIGGSNANNVACSGVGASGNGGQIWLQSLTSITSPEPIVQEGVAPTNSCGSTGPAGQPGEIRADDPTISQPPGWLTYFSYGRGVVNTVAGAYIVQSKAYDLKTMNASFPSAPTTTVNLNAGTSVNFEYQGSVDGITYTAFTTDLTTLSNQNIRYLKIRMTINAGAGLSPTVTRIEVPYTELGVPEVNFGLGFGCGQTQDRGGANLNNKNGQNPSGHFLETLFLLLVMTAGFLYFKKPSRNPITAA